MGKNNAISLYILFDIVKYISLIMLYDEQLIVFYV
jgi:hypothetical protein